MALSASDAALIRPYATCPEWLWRNIIQVESGGNPFSIGDNGSSFGLFQLHIGGQANAAFDEIRRTTGLTGISAQHYLMSHVSLQAKYGMPAINAAWNSLKGSYSPNSMQWWISFCIQSGHPGGSTTDPATLALARKLMGLAGASTSVTSNRPDNGWLQILLNHPPHQPCSIVWRRTCPGAKTAFEGGMDLASPNGTKVYALADGVVVGAGYFWHPNGNPGHGVVTLRTSFPDGTVGDLYYQHIQIASGIVLCNQAGGQLYGNIIGPKPIGQKIQKGQLLGTVVVGEVEVGINADWGGVWGSSPHPGEWVDDPEDKVRLLLSSGGGTSFTTPPLTGVDALDAVVKEYFPIQHAGLDTLTKHPGMAGPIQQFHDAQQFHPFSVPPAESASGPAGGVQSALSYPVRVALGSIQFIAQNTLPFAIRGIFSSVAFIILVALIINVTSTVSVQQHGQEEETNEYTDTEF
jgi:hypothetical protein